MSIPLNWIFLLVTTSYQLLATWIENRTDKPLGQLIDVGGYKLHLNSQGTGRPTVIIDHSLGGIEGYFLIEEIAKITRICIYDRAGYGWSEISPKPRCSEEIVQELDILLTKADIEPPYILVGNSFGSYNVRLYADRFPEKVIGIVLTDGLHEKEMLKMPFSLVILKLFFMSGFAISTLGASLGLIRILGNLGIFELIKPELRKFPKKIAIVKRSFYRPKHWLTMWREMWNLEASARQVSKIDNLSNIPIINIKAKTFFQQTLGTFYMPIAAGDRLRDKMHEELLKLSDNCKQIQAPNSSHFVWVDEPEIIVGAIQAILTQVES
ncbi:MAG: alpha/beta hydrolase [Hydrococcus sp. Prado102]|jgi:pimeloyl-ACP methyl ester carboxylesterase|nr:alpha/beta hydrolase [Hydrococcus sp. Prado102]